MVLEIVLAIALACGHQCIGNLISGLKGESERVLSMTFPS
jgi:hypothetical protein